MVEQIQSTPPPFDALTSFGLTAADTKAAASHASSTHAVPPAKQDDTVTLSASAQANQLYLQGNSVSEIAAALGLPPATVDSDLNINQVNSLTGQTAQGAAAQTASAQALPSTTTTATSAPFTAPVTKATAEATS